MHIKLFTYRFDRIRGGSICSILKSLKIVLLLSKRLIYFLIHLKEQVKRRLRKKIYKIFFFKGYALL